MNNVWTNGCFDIIHLGHVKLFEYAKNFGDYLFVGIDSDRRVKENKGPNRPINTEHSRLEVLRSIKWIDGIFIFDSDKDLKQLIKSLHIDIIVVGDDYKNRAVIGSDLVKNTIFFPKMNNFSTSNIVNSHEFSRTNKSTD